jgi:lipoprotein-releasing system ATP-binding protein
MIETTPAAASQATRSKRDSELRVADGSPVIHVNNLEKTYRTARGALTLFKGLDLDVQVGELVAIVGQSGAGKSTLLHILGALDAPTAGTVHCATTNVTALS